VPTLPKLPPDYCTHRAEAPTTFSPSETASLNIFYQYMDYISAIYIHFYIGSYIYSTGHMWIRSGRHHNLGYQPAGLQTNGNGGCACHVNVVVTLTARTRMFYICSLNPESSSHGFLLMSPSPFVFGPCTKNCHLVLARGPGRSLSVKLDPSSTHLVMSLVHWSCGFRAIFTSL